MIKKILYCASCCTLMFTGSSMWPDSYNEDYSSEGQYTGAGMNFQQQRPSATVSPELESSSDSSMWGSYSEDESSVPEGSVPQGQPSAAQVQLPRKVHFNEEYIENTFFNAPADKDIEIFNSRMVDLKKKNNGAHVPVEIETTPAYTIPAVLAYKGQEGHKNDRVMATVYADSTNFLGIMYYGGEPVATQEEGTTLCCPGIMQYMSAHQRELGVSFYTDEESRDMMRLVGVPYTPGRQIHYCMSRKNYETHLDYINPAYGYAMLNVPIVYNATGEILTSRPTVDLMFLSAPSFAKFEDSYDPTGAELIRHPQSVKDGTDIYKSFSDHSDKSPQSRQQRGKILMFVPQSELKKIGSDIDTVVDRLVKKKEGLSEQERRVLAIANQGYKNCLFEKFGRLVKTAVANQVKVLVFGSIGCGVFNNDKRDVAILFVKALAEYNMGKGKYKGIEKVILAGINEGNFADLVKTARIMALQGAFDKKAVIVGKAEQTPGKKEEIDPALSDAKRLIEKAIHLCHFTHESKPDFDQNLDDERWRGTLSLNDFRWATQGEGATQSDNKVIGGYRKNQDELLGKKAGTLVIDALCTILRNNRQLSIPVTKINLRGFGLTENMLRELIQANEEGGHLLKTLIISSNGHWSQTNRDYMILAEDDVATKVETGVNNIIEEFDYIRLEVKRTEEKDQTRNPDIDDKRRIFSLEFGNVEDSQ